MYKYISQFPDEKPSNYHNYIKTIPNVTRSDKKGNYISMTGQSSLIRAKTINQDNNLTYQNNSEMHKTPFKDEVIKIVREQIKLYNISLKKTIKEINQNYWKEIEKNTKEKYDNLLKKEIQDIKNNLKQIKDQLIDDINPNKNRLNFDNIIFDDYQEKFKIAKNDIDSLRSKMNVFEYNSKIIPELEYKVKNFGDTIFDVKKDNDINKKKINNLIEDSGKMYKEVNSQTQKLKDLMKKTLEISKLSEEHYKTEYDLSMGIKNLKNEIKKIETSILEKLSQYNKEILGNKEKKFENLTTSCNNNDEESVSNEGNIIRFQHSEIRDLKQSIIKIKSDLEEKMIDINDMKKQNKIFQQKIIKKIEEDENINILDFKIEKLSKKIIQIENNLKLEGRVQKQEIQENGGNKDNENNSDNQNKKEQNHIPNEPPPEYSYNSEEHEEK